MIGALFGFACGALEFYLLWLLVRGIEKEKIPAWVIPAKMGVLALFFVPCGLWFRGELLAAGITAAAVLILAAFALFFVRARRQKQTPAVEPLEERGDVV